MSTGDPAPPRTVEKIMSASRAEFARSLAILLDTPVPSETPAEIAIGQGRALIDFQPLPAARLGGLLELPRARIILEFQDVTSEEATAFLERFNLAFQRGGG